ncbi:MAG: glucose-6-phosphate isomerase [Vicinamibacterales bacterium]
MTLSFEPAAHLAKQMLQERVVSRIWERDISVWHAEHDSDAARSISTRLGWLDVGKTMPPHLERVARLGTDAREEAIEAVYLLGMGGSSLCAEVLRSVQGVAEGSPDLHVLDTTDERTLTSAAARMVPERTWILVASKSGSTVEVASMERYFWSRMTAALGNKASRQFIAVTDPDTALQKLAATKGYRKTFINPPDIGGRFSALSLFGLVPTALLGASARDVLSAGSVMAEGCRQENHANAGLELGAFLGAATLAGRDKLTVVLPPSLSVLGLWIEQLIAESTGKHGKGALPVVDEPLGRPDEYGQDRAFVAITTDRDAPDKEKLAALEAANHPVLRLTTRMDGLGAELFRWEFATAVAGAALGINPFDEPNVSEAKEKTKALLSAYGKDHRLPETEPLAQEGDIAVHTRAFAGATPPDVIRAALDEVKPGDYVAFLAYLPADGSVERAVAEARLAIRSRTRAATTFGVGPRYLHSTGQYHKGGPNTALAFVITADDETQTEIPDSGYSFSVLKRAQALGDFQTLEAHGRRVVRIHLEGADPAGSLERLFAEALK